MSVKPNQQVKVAVVGSGLAGLVVAYLLRNDPLSRYSVVVFESGSKPSFDAASVTIDNATTHGRPERVDVPMRAFTGGYYSNLMAMYDYLGIEYHWQKFRFVFSQDEPTNAGFEKSLESKPYFIHNSDNHQIPPLRPATVTPLAYVFELIFVVLCFAWFTISCHLISASGSDETLERYLKRVRMPHRFTERYLLPLMSAVATCSHQEMLQFPASDIIRYRKLITRRKQYAVSGGTGLVQRALARGIDIKTCMRVVQVEPRTSGFELTINAFGEEGKVQKTKEQFDQVITAVPPNIAAELFAPARKQLARIPVRTVETIVHRVRVGEAEGEVGGEAEQILLNTQDDAIRLTEATQVQKCGLAVTSFPLSSSPTRDILSRTKFTRTLRTPESRRIVQKTFEHKDSVIAGISEEKYWRNGDYNMWMVGAWCWDGMVLLEGAVVSAMRVAEALDVQIPW